MKKDYWRWVERAVWLFGIVIGAMLWLRDEAKDDAIIETQLKILIENDEKRTEYWNRQNEINGRIIMFMELDSHQSRTN